MGGSEKGAWAWRLKLGLLGLIVVIIAAVGFHHPPIDIEANLTVSRVEFVVEDSTSHTILPDVRFRGLTVAGFDSVRFERESVPRTITPSSRRIRAAVEVNPGPGAFGYFEGLSVPGQSLVNMSVPSRPETSLTIAITRPGKLVHFSFWASTGDTLLWSNVDLESELETLPESSSRIRFEVFASGPISVTVYPDSAVLPGLVTPEPVPTDRLNLTRRDQDANRARSALVEAASIRFVRYPRLDPAVVATFQTLKMVGKGPLYLEETHFERRGNRPALRLTVRGTVEDLHVAGSGHRFLPSFLRRLQHDDLFWPILVVVGGLLSLISANISWWIPEGPPRPDANDRPGAEPAGAAQSTEGSSSVGERASADPGKRT